MTKSSRNNSIILVAIPNIIKNSEHMIKGRTRSQRTYWAFVDGDAVAITGGADRVTTVLWTKCSRRRWRWRYAATLDFDGGRARWRSRAVARAASQKSYSPSSGAGSQRREIPETCSLVHRCMLALRMEKTTVAAQQREEAKP